MTLKLAARCALADFIGLWEREQLDDLAMMQTVLDLADALENEGEDLSDYKELQAIRESLADWCKHGL